MTDTRRDSPDPYQPLDPETRAAMAALFAGARHAVLGTLDAGGAPVLTRIAMQRGADGAPVALISGLAGHSAALARDPRCGLFIDAPGGKGGIMAQPRLSLTCRATPIDEPPEADAGRRARWRAADPKAAVYLGLADFRFWRLEPVWGLYNAGFGRAYRLGPGDPG